MSRLAAVRARTGVLLSVVAFAGLAAALWYDVGVAGPLVAAAVGVTWLLAAAPYAVAVGYLAVVLVVDPATAVATHVGLAAILAADLATGRRPQTGLRAIVAFAVVALALGAVVRFEPPFAAAGVLALVVAGVGYALHRYELVRLGLVDATADEHNGTGDTLVDATTTTAASSTATAGDAPPSENAGPGGPS